MKAMTTLRIIGIFASPDLSSVRTALSGLSRNVSANKSTYGEAVQLLDSLAENDSQLVMVAGEIHIERLRKLDFLRAKNLLRYIFSRRDIIQPSTQKLEEILRQLWMAKSDNYLYLTFGEFEIRLYKNLVRLLPKAKSKLPGSDQDQLFYWHGEPNWVIEPLGGVIKWSNSVGIGINAKKLMENSVAVRLRKGGERFQLNCKRPRRSLKKIFQKLRYQNGSEIIYHCC